MGFFVTFSIAIIYLLSASVGVAESSLGASKSASKSIKSESSVSCKSQKSQAACQKKSCKKIVLDFLWIQNDLLFNENLVSLSTISQEDVKQIHPRTLRINSGLSPPV